MDREVLIGNLSSLAQMDVDAARVYAEAVRHIEDPAVRARLEDFGAQHEGHAKALADVVVHLGGERPPMEVDTAGRLADWYTAMRSVSGQSGALRAMESAEKYHVRRYSEAAEQWDVYEEDVGRMLRHFYADERVHLEYVESTLKEPVGKR